MRQLMQLVTAIRPGHVVFGFCCGIAAWSDLADPGATILAALAGIIGVAAIGAETIVRGGV